MEIAFLFSAVLLLIVAVIHSCAVESVSVFDSLQGAMDSANSVHQPHHDHHRRRDR